MKTMPMALAAVLLAGCASLGEVDDHGRAYREAQNAPVDANLEPLAAEPSINLVNERIPARDGDGGSARTESEPTSACEAEKWQVLIGRPKSDLDGMDLPEDVRIIPHGAMVTQDYIPGRLNVYVGPDDRVFRVTCG